jgi:lipopolysaccharide transport system ATP-binding protein
MSKKSDHLGSVISCDHISKSYKLFSKNRDRFMEFCSGGILKKHKLFYALDDISFSVGPGECMGIVGENGSGKSTLLKIITGTTFVDRGTVEVKGRVSALLELGTGFHPELTGRQNIQLNSQFYKFSKEERETLEDRVKNFSELDDYFDQPIKTYSSGMHVRLGFALAININPDIIIIDEALAVGDAYFQQKCIKKIKDFIASGVTCLFVSHDPALIKLLCSKAILLHQGKMIETGTPKTVLNVYNGIIAQHQKSIRYEVQSAEKGMVQHGNRKVIIQSTKLFDETGKEGRLFSHNEKIKISVVCRSNEIVPQCCVGVLITDMYGLEVFGVNTLQKELQISFSKIGDCVQVDFLFQLNCGTGKYFISIAAHLQETHIAETFDWKDNVFQFEVAHTKVKPFTGRTYLEHSIHVEPI